MLGTTISSGRANSPKLTANIADHGTIYGGRGLIFDGVTDYLDCGDISGIDGASAYTFTAWIKPDDTSNAQVVISKRTSDSTRLHMTLSSNNMYLATSSGSDMYGNVAYTSTDWQHIAMVFNGSGTGNAGRLKFYVNGEEQTLSYTGTIPATLPDNGSNSFMIGRQHTSYFDGKISDVKLFSTNLTEAQVQELYLKPEQSAPSAVQDNIVAWYPMCEGNPDSPQSIVYDHSEKGLGSELITDGGFDDASYWSAAGDWSVSGSKATSGAGGSDILQPSSDHSLSNGKLYKFTASITLVSGSGSFLFYANDVNTTVTVTSGTNTYTAYLTSDGTVPRIRMNSGTLKIEVDDFSVKEVIMGNHATTNFFGDELLTNDDANWDTTGAFTSWGYYSSTTNSGAGELKQDGFTLSAGKTYTFTFVLGLGNNMGIAIESYDSAVVYVAEATYAKQESHTVTFTPSSDKVGINLVVDGSVAGDCNVTTSSFSLKEVGISSTGFATADSEPTIPQVPLMRYNEKMIANRNYSADVNLASTIDLPASSPFTVAFSYVGYSENENHALGGDGSNDSFRVDIGSSGQRVCLRIGGSSGWFSSLGSSIVIGGKNFFVITRTSAGALTVYNNGIAGSLSAGSSTLASNFQISAIGGGNTYWFGDGVYDETSVWNHTMTATEVQELFNDGVVLDATTHSKADYLAGYWRNDGISSWVDRAPERMLFDGSDDKVTCGNLINGRTTITMAAWFKTTNDSQNDIIGELSGSSNVGLRLVSRSSTSGIWLQSGNGSSGTLAVYGDSGAHRDGNWHHIVGTYDGSTLKMYFDGATTPVATASASSLTFNMTTGFTIGGAYPEYMNGMIDECALWGTALTATEVAELYALGLNGNILTHSNQTNLVSYWKNEGITDAKWIDHKGSNNGTVAGSPTLIGGNNGTPAGTPESIIVREGLNSNKDGLGFPFKTDNRDVVRFSNSGVAEYVSIADSDSFDVQDGFTVEFWYKQPDTASTYQQIINRDDGTNRSWRLYSSAGALTFDLLSGGAPTIVSTSNTFDDDDWHHVCIIVKAGTSIQIYVDKVLEKLSSGYSASGVLAAETEGASASSVTLTVDTVSATDELFKNKEVYKSDGTFFGICTAVNSTTEIVFAGGLSNGITNNDNLHPSAVPITIDNDPSVFNIGKRTGTTQFFIGLIDEVRFYNKALTAYESDGSAPEESETATSGEVVKNYNHGKGKHKN